MYRLTSIGTSVCLITFFSSGLSFLAGSAYCTSSLYFEKVFFATCHLTRPITQKCGDALSKRKPNRKNYVSADQKRLFSGINRPKSRFRSYGRPYFERLQSSLPGVLRRTQVR